MNTKVFLVSVLLFVPGISLIGCNNQDSVDKQDSGTVQTENSVPAAETEVSAESTEVTEAGSEGTDTDNPQKAEFIDGVYEGKSDLTSEGYYGEAKVTIKNGKINDVYFEIYDTAVFKSYGNSKHKDEEKLLLDESYREEVYENAPEYQEQTTNELAGMKKFKSELVQKQDVDEVDAVSGATWSGKIFKETIKNTLEKAIK